MTAIRCGGWNHRLRLIPAQVATTRHDATGVLRGCGVWCRCRTCGGGLGGAWYNASRRGQRCCFNNCVNQVWILGWCYAGVQVGTHLVIHIRVHVIVVITSCVGHARVACCGGCVENQGEKCKKTEYSFPHYCNDRKIDIKIKEKFAIRKNAVIMAHVFGV